MVRDCRTLLGCIGGASWYDIPVVSGCRVVAFCSAKGRSFAERKTTVFRRRSTAPLPSQGKDFDCEDEARHGTQRGLHRRHAAAWRASRSTWRSPIHRSTSASSTTCTMTVATMTTSSPGAATGLSEVVRVLKPDGTFWLAIGDEYAAELKVLMQRELHLVCRSWVVWYYTFGVNCKYKFRRSHAHLFYMVKDPQKFTFKIDDRSECRRRDNWSMAIGARIRRDGCRTTRGFCVRRICRTDSSRWKTPGTFRASRELSRNEPDSTVARCPSNCWDASSAPAATTMKSYSTRSLAVAPRWPRPRNSAGTISASNCRPITRGEAASARDSSPVTRSMERPNRW